MCRCCIGIVRQCFVLVVFMLLWRPGAEGVDAFSPRSVPVLFLSKGCQAGCSCSRVEASTLCRREAASMVTSRVGVECISGSDPNRPQKVNQDAYCFSTIFEVPLPDRNENERDASLSPQTMMTTSFGTTSFGMASVMDGHGKRGHELTQYLASHLPKCLEQQFLRSPFSSNLTELESQIQRLAKFNVCQPPQKLDEPQDHVSWIHSTLQRTFHQAQWDAMQNPQVPAGQTAGTTCVVCLWEMATRRRSLHTQNQQVDEEEKELWIHVAHVGDSRIYRFDFEICEIESNNTSSTKSLHLICTNMQALNTPTTVLEMETERKRMEDCIVESGATIDNNGNVWYGPVAIAMTRALGDSVMMRAGVIPTPITESFQLSLGVVDSKKKMTTLVLATDGVWDVLSPQDIKEALLERKYPLDDDATNEGANYMAKRLAYMAKNAWMTDLPIMEDKIDDITCLVVDLFLD